MGTHEPIRHRVTQAISGLSVLATAFFSVDSYLRDRPFATLFVTLALGFFMSAHFVWCALFPGQKGQRAVVALVLMMAFAFFFATGVSGGAGVLWSLLVPTSCFFLLGLRTGFWAALIYLFSLVLLRLALGDQAPQGFVYQGDFLARFVGVYIISGAVAMAFEYGRIKGKAELEHAMARAEAANRAKSDFLSTMSHEIRTPLHGVLGMGSVLADSQLDVAQKESLETMLSSGRHLLGLINDLLDFSKIEAGKLELDPRPFLLTELGEDLSRMLGPLAREKGLDFRTKFEIAPELWVFGDQPRLRQILTNLLGNAMKFTPSGYIALRIVALMDADNGVLLRAEVQDSGVGIPYSKQSVIFDSFGQADASTAREFGGTGLGLSISRSLARLMGGDMGVHSEVGQGSTFWLSVPLAIAIAPLTTVDAKHKLPEAPHGHWKILLVDDNAVNLKVGRRMLEKLHCEVLCAADGELAVQAWQQHSPDLILMDMRMPVLDGIGATCKIREAELGQGLRRTPIVALTANSFVEDRDACFAAGMDDFLAKPFTPQALREILARLLVQS